MEYRQTNNSHTRGARVHAYAVRGLLRPLRWGYASLLVLELCFTVRADRKITSRMRSGMQSSSTSGPGSRDMKSRTNYTFLSSNKPTQTWKRKKIRLLTTATKRKAKNTRVTRAGRQRQEAAHVTKSQ